MLNTHEIQEIIPHRHPMLLIDKITELEVGKRAVGIKAVTVNEFFFQGHFPEYYVMPGVLIIEALAQVGAVALLSEEENKGKLALFGGIKNAKFKHQVTPGDVLRLECELTNRRGFIGKGKATAYVEDKVAATAELTFVIK